MFTFNRLSLDLNGTWKFCPDPMQRCRRQQWWKNPTKHNSMFPCWDVDGLWDIQVPGSWKTQFEKLSWYDGHAVYMRDFDAELPPGHEAFLCFDGVVYASQVYLNGQFMGERDWGYSPFQLRVTETLRSKNRLFVLVENYLKPDRVPGEIYDWNNDGGIINGVKLVFVPVTHVPNFRVATRLDGDDAVVKVDAWLSSRDTSVSERVSVRFPELSLEQDVTIRAGDMQSVEFRLPRDHVALWCPENPKLYRTEITTRFETLDDDVALREIKTVGREIVLNGEPVRLYGLCHHSDFPVTGRTATPEGIERMVAMVKELGCNFIRCAHYPFAEIFGRAMDRAGIMWWQEVPVYWLLNMGLESQTRLACGMLEETIRRDWNRGSLIIWSVSNECCWRNPEKPSENNYPYWFKAVPMVRSLDPTRLISCAEAGNMISVSPVWTPGKNDEFDRATLEAQSWRPGHTDEWYGLIDILSANLYVNEDKDVEPTYRRYVEMFSRYNKPMIISEFGSISLRGAKVPDDELGSEVRHASLLRTTYDVFERLPELVGYCPWSLADVRGPLHWRWYCQGKGLFRYGFCDENWVRKEVVWDALKKAIAQLKAKHAAR
jgi:beta-glucuronidase